MEGVCGAVHFDAHHRIQMHTVPQAQQFAAEQAWTRERYLQQLAALPHHQMKINALPGGREPARRRTRPAH